MKMNKKMAGEGRKLPGVGKHGCGCQRWLKATVAAVEVFLPSLLSPLFLFSALSSVSSWPSAAVRWCAVAVERKHGGSCGSSSSFSLVFLLLSALSLSFGFFFFSVDLPPLSVSVFASSSVSHGAGAVIEDWEDCGSWRWLWWLWQEATVERETKRGAAAGNLDKR
jgi:hypothetical protein